MTLWTEYKPVWVLSDSVVSHIWHRRDLILVPGRLETERTGSSPQIVWDALCRGFANCYSSFKTQVGMSHLPWEAYPEKPSHPSWFQLHLTTGCGLYLRLLKKLSCSTPLYLGKWKFLKRNLCFKICISSLSQRMKRPSVILVWNSKLICNPSQNSSPLLSLYSPHVPLERVKA